MDMVQNAAIIVAGGKGVRMGGPLKKQYLQLAGRPVLTRTLQVFDRCQKIDKIVLVVPKGDISFCRQQIIKPFDFRNQVHIVEGGNERQDSVFNGLEYLQNLPGFQKDSVVLIHDGVRPLVTGHIIRQAILTAVQKKACVPGIHISDTVKEINHDRRIEKNIKRDCLVCVQTPQAFEFGLIWDAFGYARKNGFAGTDDAAVIENFGEPVYVIEGSKNNIKITTPEDIKFAEYVLQSKDFFHLNDINNVVF